VNLNDFLHVVNWIQLAQFMFFGGSYENGLQRLGSMKGGKFIYGLSGQELLQKDFLT
jgi:hypothetical protein